MRVTLVESLICVAIFGVVGLIAYAIWLECVHPCIRRGPPRLVTTMQYCGENCWMPVTQEVRDCLERTP